MWRPFIVTPDEQANRGNQFLVSVGRLKSGVSLRQAQGELSAIAARLSESYPNTDSRQSLRLVSLAKSVLSDNDRKGFWFLLGLTSFVLLIACANLANLQMART